MASDGFKWFQMVPRFSKYAITLRLQKPSAQSKAKEHSVCLIRRLQDWRNGEINILVKELRHIPKRFTSSRKTRSVEDRARIFSNLVMEAKITAALKFLDTDISSGILTLTPDIIADLEQKHPDAEAIADNTLLNGPLDPYSDLCF